MTPICYCPSANPNFMLVTVSCIAIFLTTLLIFELFGGRK